MSNFINRYATPLTTGLFFVSLVSGLALFFGWLPQVFHGMHEWLSLLLLLPFALHMVKNWRALAAYAKRKTLVVPLVLSLAVAVPFAIAGLSRGPGGNPGARAVGVMTQAPLAALAPVLKTTPEALIEALTAQGLTVPSADTTLAAVAAAGGKQPNTLLISLLPKP